MLMCEPWKLCVDTSIMIYKLFWNKWYNVYALKRGKIVSEGRGSVFKNKLRKKIGKKIDTLYTTYKCNVKKMVQHT